MGKTYKIETVQDMIDCTNENNLENFLVDLKGLLTYAHAFRALSDVIVETSGGKGKVSPVKTGKYTWVDDGKHEAKITIEAK